MHRRVGVSSRDWAPVGREQTWLAAILFVSSTSTSECFTDARSNWKRWNPNELMIDRIVKTENFYEQDNVDQYANEIFIKLSVIVFPSMSIHIVPIRVLVMHLCLRFALIRPLT